MSIIDAFKVYGSLDSEQKGLLERKRVEGTHTVDEWIRLLDNVATYDRHADDLRKTAGWMIVVAIAGLFVGIFLPILLIPFLLLGIIAVILYLRLRSRDIPNNLRFFVLPLLALLREDMERDTPLTLQLDLTGGRQKEKITGSREFGPGNPRIKENIYRDLWMQGRGALADGTTVDWSIADDIRERVVTKRNPRGKTKVKTKYKVRRVIDARVGLRHDEYALAAAPDVNGVRDRVAVKEGEKRNVVRLRRQLVSTEPDKVLAVKEFVDLLAGAYRRVQLNKPEGA